MIADGSSCVFSCRAGGRPARCDCGVFAASGVGAFVVDDGRKLLQPGGVLVGVVPAEQQLPTIGQYHPDSGGRTAAVASISSGQRRRRRHSSGHVILPSDRHRGGGATWAHPCAGGRSVLSHPTPMCPVMFPEFSNRSQNVTAPSCRTADAAEAGFAERVTPSRTYRRHRRQPEPMATSVRGHRLRFRDVRGLFEVIAQDLRA